MKKRKDRKVWELWDQPVRTRPYMAVHDRTGRTR